MNYIGLDIGGSKFLVASADAQGNIRQRVQRPTPPALEDGIALLHEMIAIVSDGQPASASSAVSRIVPGAVKPSPVDPSRMPISARR